MGTMKGKEKCMDIKKATKRQFDKILNRDGKTVYIDETPYKVLFRKLSARNTEERILVSYPQEYGWHKGIIFRYHDEYWIITNRDAFESEIYFTSCAVKCNCNWNVNGNVYHFVAGDLASPNPKNGALTSSLKGTITVYTTKSDIFNIGDTIWDFGYHFAIVNKFTTDNLTYYYLSADSECTINNWKINTSLTNNYYVDNEPEINASIYSEAFDGRTCYLPTNYDIDWRYVSSDETVARIDNEGHIVFVSDGTVNIDICATIYPENGGILEIPWQTFNLTVYPHNTPYVDFECYVGKMGTALNNTVWNEYNEYVNQGNPVKQYSRIKLIAKYTFNQEIDETKVPSSWSIKDNGIHTYTNVNNEDEISLGINTKPCKYKVYISDNELILSPSNAITISDYTPLIPITISVTYSDGTTGSYDYYITHTGI